MKNSKKGFTLMELLVVVAIIGVLVSVVSVFLTTARKRGGDSAIKEQVAALRSQAELYALSNNNSYVNLFTNNNTWASADIAVQAILTSIAKQTIVFSAGSSVSAWAAQAQLKEDATNYVCIDSTNVVKIGTNVLAAGEIICP